MSKPKSPPSSSTAAASADAWDPMDPLNDQERRRYGRIDRDDRGHAVVTWVKPPQDWERSSLSLVEEPPATAAGVTATRGYDPYESSNTGSSATWNTAPARLARPARTDLRRLSEHIKQMRALKDRQDEGK